MHRFVLSSKVPPLKTVNWAKVPFLTVLKPYLIKKLTRCITVPDFDFLITEMLCIRVTSDKPYQLFRYSPPEHILGRQHWKAFRQIVPHLVSKLADNSRASPVSFLSASLNYLFDGLQVLVLLVSGVHLEKLSRDQMWLLVKHLLVSVKTVIKSYFIFRLRISLRDVERCKMTFKVRHLDVMLVISVDARGNYKFTL